MMKRITEIDVQSMADEINDSLWNLVDGGYRRGWGGWQGTESQTLIRYVNHDNRDPSPEYDPCEHETPLDDLCLPGFRPTNVLFMYPEAMKTLIWFATTYGGKYARAIYYRTPPNTGVGMHLDAQPDKFTLSERRSSNKHPLFNHLFFYKKDRFHMVIDGSFEYTVDHEEEDRIYEFPIKTMTQPVTKTFSKGEVWWFNNKRPHKSYNSGAIPKINLVLDVEGSSCLTNLK